MFQEELLYILIRHTIPFQKRQVLLGTQEEVFLAMIKLDYESVVMI